MTKGQPDEKEEPIKKSESKHGLSKETLERILEDKKPRRKIVPIKESDSRLSEEELKMLSQRKPEEEDSEEGVQPDFQRRPVFLEKELSKEPSGNLSKEDSDAEYLTRQQSSEKADKAKYVKYESDSSVKIQKAGEIAKSWSQPFQNREPQFISSHPEIQGQKPKYETYFTPKSMTEQELKDLSKSRESPNFGFKEEKMHYYND